MLGGALAGLCFLPASFGAWFWVAWAPLLWAVEDLSPGPAFFSGLLFGAAGWGVGMGWLYQTIARFTPFPRPMTLAVFGLFCAFHGLAAGCWAATTRLLAPRLARRLGGREEAALAAVAVPGLVWTHAYFPSLFPAPFAATQLFHLPFLQSLELFGTAGPAWLIAAGNVGAYLAWRRRRFGLLAAAALLALANEGYGLWRLHTLRLPPPSYSAALIQSDVAVDAAGNRKALKLSVLNRLTQEALARGPLDLAVWPETSYDAVLPYPFEDTLARVLEADIPHPATILLGALARDARGGGKPRLYNAALLTGPDRRPLGSDFKRYLMPFGEHIPFGDLLPGLYALSPRTADLARGGDPIPLDAGKDARLGVLICYEDVIAEYVREYVRRGATVLVVLANDGWIVPPGPETHLRLGILRAIETRRWLLRAVNTGISAVVDPTGRILSRLDAGQGFLRASVAPVDMQTPFVRLGGFLYPLALILWLALAAYSYRNGR